MQDLKTPRRIGLALDHPERRLGPACDQPESAGRVRTLLAADRRTFKSAVEVGYKGTWCERIALGVSRST